MLRYLLTAALLLFAGAALAQAELTAPGRYEIVVTQELPNVQRAAEPIKVEECITMERIRNGEAFRLRSTEPALAACALSNVHFDGDHLTYRMRCEQPNAPSAKGKFGRTRTGYEGAIALDMGAKNMTMTERHLARRLGDCPEAKSKFVRYIDAEAWRKERGLQPW